MFKLKFIGTSLLVVVATALLPVAAGAAVVTFFGNDQNPGGLVSPSGAAATARAGFSAALASSTGESFESPSILTGTAPTTTAPLSVFAGAGSLFRNEGTFGVARVENRTQIGEFPSGRFNTTSLGTKWWEASASFSLNFNTGIQALGFYGTDFGDFDGVLRLSFFSGADEVDLNVSVPSSAGGNGSLLFFGYINSIAFDRVVFNIGQADPNNQGTFDILGFDDFIIGTSRTPPPTGVPEPGTLALVALSLGLLAARRRLR